MTKRNNEKEKEYQHQYYKEHDRKTYTSNEVKSRYIKKTYVRYGIALRMLEDAKVIELIEKEKEKGFSTTEAIKRLITKKEV